MKKKCPLTLAILKKMRIIRIDLLVKRILFYVLLNTVFYTVIKYTFYLSSNDRWKWQFVVRLGKIKGVYSEKDFYFETELQKLKIVDTY